LPLPPRCLRPAACARLLAPTAGVAGAAAVLAGPAAVSATSAAPAASAGCAEAPAPPFCAFELEEEDGEDEEEDGGEEGGGDGVRSRFRRRPVFDLSASFSARARRASNLRDRTHKTSHALNGKGDASFKFLAVAPVSFSTGRRDGWLNRSGG